MTDLINKEDAIQVFIDWEQKEFGFSDLNKGERFIDAIEAVPVQHEECEYTIAKGKAGYHEEYKCSACGDSFYWTQDRYIPRRFNYCRNCGRKVIRFIEKDKEGMTNNE